MTNRFILIPCVFGMAIAGCKTAQMKSTPFYEGDDAVYTGKAEDRVNLWPLAYWREPVGSVLWPVVSFSDDHFAVRPLYSRYGDEYNFLWPFSQYDSGSGYGRVFPFYWGRSHFNVFPVMWNSRDFHSLFPVLFYEEEDYLTLFPFLWWDIDGGEFALFPVFGGGGDADWIFPLYYRDEETTLVTPFYGRSRDGYSWLIPLYWHDRDVTWITPLYGRSRNGDSWLFPLYASAGGDFVSPLFCGGSNGADAPSEESWWFAPPLLSGGSRSKGVGDLRFLLGLGGYTKGEGIFRHWLVPFWYHDGDMTLATPVYGKTKDAEWLFPLWYRDEDLTLATPLYGQNRDSRWLAPLFYKDETDLVTPLWWQSYRWDTGETESWMIPPLLTGGGVNGDGSRYFYSPVGGFNAKEGGIFPLFYTGGKGFYSIPFCRTEGGGWTTYSVPPLLSWFESSGDGESRMRLLLGLAGWDSDGENWLFPVYKYDAEHGDLRTALFGRMTSGGYADWWFCTPFAGFTTGDKPGFWLWPLVGWRCDEDFHEMERMIDSGTLDASIAGSVRKERDWSVQDGSVTNDVFRTGSEVSTSSLRFASDLMGTTRSISYDGGDNAHIYDWKWRVAREAAGDEWRTGKERTVVFVDERSFGNGITFGGEKTRLVNFDYDTKEKVFDGEFEEAESLFGLLWSSRTEKIASGHEYKKMALLWRLWHREELDGDSTTDVFPFITHDSRKDGYSKISFLWRFFRYERDPEKGTSLDLLFVPVRR